ncbi:MAG: NAD(P)H-hydrate dehydratase [bacterium]|nr:NAD(P)H-hydrate dehydratase [bacterium]
MRVCTASQMAAIDRDTIAGGLPGLELMERAGTALTEVVLEELESAAGHQGCGHEDCGHGAATAPRILVLCGKGNNGGDGLVVARLLAGAGVGATVFLLADPETLSPDAAANFLRLPDGVDVVVSPPEGWLETLDTLLGEADLVVDAIFGTGIEPPLRSPYPELFHAMNDAGLTCVAADIPSGVSGDDGRVDPVAVAADVTVTMGLPKRGLLTPPGRDFAGEVVPVDIGFPAEICARHAPDHHWLTRRDHLALLPPRPTNTHKYLCGSVLVVAGSRAYGGAAHLAGLGALRSGAGLVTVAAPACLETALRVGLPEALVVPLAETAVGTLAPGADTGLDSLLPGRRALAIGPGMGDDPATDAWLVEALGRWQTPLVVDADALNAFARTGTEPRFATADVVLTPHAGEMARLCGVPAAEIVAGSLEIAAECAARWNCVLLLKGAPTVVATPDGRVRINASGDDALARGGSGDVLAGLIAGLLAQGSTAPEAALLGAYVHGLAGTRAAAGCSTRAVLVREIAAAIGPVFQEMEQEASSDAELRELLWPTGEAL